MPRLYELSADYTMLSEMLENAYTPEAQQEIAVALHNVRGNVLQKADSIVALVKELEYHAEAVECEIVRLRARARASETKAEWLRGYLLQQLDLIGQNHIKTPRFTINVQTTQAVEITSEAELPSQFKKTVVSMKPDKTAIREAILENGEVVPGAEIIQNKHLRIT